jgi:hypothetical protein
MFSNQDRAYLKQNFDQIDAANKAVMIKVQGIDKGQKVILAAIKELQDSLDQIPEFVTPELEQQIKFAWLLATSVDLKVPDLPSEQSKKRKEK